MEDNRSPITSKESSESPLKKTSYKDQSLDSNGSVSGKRSLDEAKKKKSKRSRRDSRSPSKYESRDRKHRSEKRGEDSRRRKRSTSRERRRSRDRKDARDDDRYRRSRHHRHRSSPRRHTSRRRSQSSSPHRHHTAMDAQEALARRLDRAAENRNRKDDFRGDRSLSGFNSQNLSAQASAEVLALRAKVKEQTGVEVPSIYNPLAINTLAYANQMVKRKKLWNKSDKSGSTDSKSDNNALWSSMSLGDAKKNEKFAKLMGIKPCDKPVHNQRTDEVIKNQSELFTNLDLQYQQAREMTHTKRGVGLGFSSSYVDPNVLPTNLPSSST